MEYFVERGGYAAHFSALGGCALTLSHLATGASLLRYEGEEKRAADPLLYGVPVLFPPNRIRGGEFVFEGRKYSFPVNEPSTGCHIHGALYALPFSAEYTACGVRFCFRAETGEYLGFPHAFTFEREFSLGEDGLTEKTTVCNRSPSAMPLMLAYHTTFRIPFLPNTGKEEYRVRFAAEREQVRGADFLPTDEWRRDGRVRALGLGELPADRPLSALMEGRGEVRIEHGSGLAVSYAADPSFRYRMLYAREGLFVAEPQTCAIDCFHRSLPPERLGLLRLPQGSARTFLTKISLTR